MGKDPWRTPRVFCSKCVFIIGSVLYGEQAVKVLTATFEWVRQHSPWWLTSLVLGLFLIAVAALSGVIQNYYNGEEFYIYHYANGLPHVQAWQQFFYENSRLIEGIFWTYQYKLLGYNPLLTHSFSFVLVLITAILASACFLNVWPQKNRIRALPYLFVFLFFLNWASTSIVFRQSYDNSRISLIFFFLAGLAVQRWAAVQRPHWLLLSFAFWLGSVLTYENAVFLFPALLWLAWPLLPAHKRTSLRSQTTLFAELTTISGLILLIPFWLYSQTARSETFDIASMPANVIGAGPAIYWGFSQFFNLGVVALGSFVAIGLFLILVLSSLWLVRLHRGSNAARASETELRWTCVYFASLWFVIFGPLPYILLGYGISGRVYSSAVFGVVPLMLLLYEAAEKRVRRMATIALLLLFAASGLIMAAQEMVRVNQSEASLNIFYRGLKDAIPNVERETVFVIINGSIGVGSCGESLEMLYNKEDLKCAVLRPTSSYDSIRHATELESSGQHLPVERWILILVVDNVPTMIDELKPGDFGLRITWESTEPMRTNPERILTRDLPPPSDFYLHLLERAEVLFP